MRLTLFIEGGDAAGAPCVELDHVSAALSVHHACYADHAKSSTLAIHHITPAHARQLIEMLTPIAGVPTHKLKVEAEGRHVRFVCVGSCHLFGPLRDTQGEALEDFKAHVAAQDAAIAAPAKGGEADVKYPDITVQLIGESGNAFAIIGAGRVALRRAAIGKAEIEAFTAEASSGDYDHLLQAVMKWVNVE